MRYLILTILLLLSSLALCQSLPVKKLQALGLTDAEIEATANLNGKNGVNGYYVLVRKKLEVIRKGMSSPSKSIELYTSEGKITQLIGFKNTIEKLIFFDILDKHIILVEHSPFSRRPITVSRFNLKGELERTIAASKPCHYSVNCDWIEKDNHLLALYDIEIELKSNIVGNITYTYDPRKYGSVHEYNWKTDETTLLFDKVELMIDAGFRGNFALTYVTFNEETGHFEYFEN